MCHFHLRCAGRDARHSNGGAVPYDVHADPARAAQRGRRRTSPRHWPVPDPEPAGGLQDVWGDLREGLRRQRPMRESHGGLCSLGNLFLVLLWTQILFLLIPNRRWPTWTWSKRPTAMPTYWNWDNSTKWYWTYRWLTRANRLTRPAFTSNTRAASALLDVSRISPTSSRVTPSTPLSSPVRWETLSSAGTTFLLTFSSSFHLNFVLYLCQSDPVLKKAISNYIFFLINGIFFLPLFSSSFLITLFSFTLLIRVLKLI